MIASEGIDSVAPGLSKEHPGLTATCGPCRVIRGSFARGGSMVTRGEGDVGSERHPSTSILDPSCKPMPPTASVLHSAPRGTSPAPGHGMAAMAHLAMPGEAAGHDADGRRDRVVVATIAFCHRWREFPHGI